MEYALWTAAVNGLIALVKFLGEQKATNSRTGKWTPEEKTAAHTKWIELQKDKAFLTDEEGG